MDARTIKGEAADRFQGEFLPIIDMRFLWEHEHLWMLHGDQAIFLVFYMISMTCLIFLVITVPLYSFTSNAGYISIFLTASADDWRPAEPSDHDSSRLVTKRAKRRRVCKYSQLLSNNFIETHK